MNRTDRDRLRDAAKAVRDAAGVVRLLRDKARDAYDGIPETMWGSDREQELQERYAQLCGIRMGLEQLADKLSDLAG